MTQSMSVAGGGRPQGAMTVPWVLQHEAFAWWIRCEYRDGIYRSPHLTRYLADATRFPTQGIAERVAAVLLSYRPRPYYQATEVAE